METTYTCLSEDDHFQSVLLAGIVRERIFSTLEYFSAICTVLYTSPRLSRTRRRLRKFDWMSLFVPPSSLETSFCIITISFCALYFNRIEN